MPAHIDPLHYTMLSLPVKYLLRIMYSFFLPLSQCRVLPIIDVIRDMLRERRWPSIFQSSGIVVPAARADVTLYKLRELTLCQCVTLPTSVVPYMINSEVPDYHQPWLEAGHSSPITKVNR